MVLFSKWHRFLLSCILLSSTPPPSSFQSLILLNPPPSPPPPLLCPPYSIPPHSSSHSLNLLHLPPNFLPHSCTSFPQSPSTHPHHSILISSSAHPYSCSPFPHPSTLVKPTPLFPLSPFFYPPTPHSHTFLLHSTILLSSLLPIFSQDLNILGNVFFTCTQKIKNHICNSERGL